MRIKAIALLVIAAAIAAAGAGWKWQHRTTSQGVYEIAGWTWGEGGADIGSD